MTKEELRIEWEKRIKDFKSSKIYVKHCIINSIKLSATSIILSASSSVYKFNDDSIPGYRSTNIIASFFGILSKFLSSIIILFKLS
ncbi:hypothetical protein KHQ81_08380 [Mycoplasmatota bacterium]|nr:hypothetical protein KHQ81_08380 [Mycoplasmatota bacterium]